MPPNNKPNYDQEIAQLQSDVSELQGEVARLDGEMQATATLAGAANSTAAHATATANNAQMVADGARSTATINSEDIAALDGRVTVLEGGGGNPPDPPDPNPEPEPDDPTDDWSLFVDPNQEIRAEWEPWFSRAVDGLNSTGHYRSWREAAAKGDLYDLFRVWGALMSLALAGLRATGRPEFLAIVQAMLDSAKPSLVDNGGWMGWRWLLNSNSEWYNRWDHSMDTMGTWGAVAMAARACFLNGDTERAAFWFDNLSDQRQGWADAGKGLPRHSLTHPCMSMAMYHHAIGETAEAEAWVARLRAGLGETGAGIRYWHHFLDGPTTSYPGPQLGRYYPSESFQGIIHLAWEGYDIGMTFANIAKAWNRDVYPDENHSDSAWSNSLYALSIAWDPTGELRQYAMDVNATMGDGDRDVPRRAYIATGLLIDQASQFPPDRRPSAGPSPA